MLATGHPWRSWSQTRTRKWLDLLRLLQSISASVKGTFILEANAMYLSVFSSVGYASFAFQPLDVLLEVYL